MFVGDPEFWGLRGVVSSVAGCFYSKVWDDVAHVWLDLATHVVYVMQHVVNVHATCEFVHGTCEFIFENVKWSEIYDVT